MKKKFFALLMTFAMVFPCAFLLSACGDPSVTGYKVFIDGNEVSATNNTLNFDYGESVNVASEIVVKVQFDDDTEKVVNAGDGGYTYTITPTMENVPNADTYVLKIKYGDLDEVTINIIVAKSNVSPTISNANAIYGNQISYPTVSGNTGNADVTFYYNTTNSATGGTEITNQTRLDAGDYYIYGVLAATGNYNTATTNVATLHVAKLALAKPTLSGTYTYTGENQTAVLNNFVAEAMNITGNVRKNAGTTDIIISLKDTANCEWNDMTNDNVVLPWIIAKAPATTPASTPNALSGQYNPNKKLSDYELPANFYWLNPDQVPTYNVLGYQAYYNEDRTNHENHAINVQIAISKADTRISSIDSLSKVYDGNPVTTTPTKTILGYNNGNPTGFELDETLNVTLEFKRATASSTEYTTIAPSAIGSYKVRVTVASGMNYNGCQEEYTFNITAKDRTLTIDKDLDKTYDGNAVSLTKSDITVVGGGNIVIEYRVENSSDDTYSTTAPKNAGEYIVRVSVGANNNYKFVSTTKAFEIEKANNGTLSFSLNGNNLAGPYWYQEVPLTLTVAGALGTGTTTITVGKEGDTGTATLTGTALTITKAGTITFIANNPGDENYKAATEIENTITYNKAIGANRISYATNRVTKTYGDENFTNPLTNNKGFTIAYSISNGENIASINETTGEVTILGVTTNNGIVVSAYFAGNDLYSFGTVSYTLVINQATNSFTTPVAIADWYYGATPSSPTGAAKFGNIVFEYKLKTAEDTAYTTSVPTAVGEYTLRATVAGTNNYTALTQTKDFSITLEQNSFTTAVSITGWNYGEQANAPTGAAKFGTIAYEYKLKTAEDTAYTTTVPTLAGTYTLRATTIANENYSSCTQYVDFTIAKVDDPSYVVPSPFNVTATKPITTLEDFDLPANFTWDDEDTVVEEGTDEYPATYTPTNENYNVKHINISITLSLPVVETTVAYQSNGDSVQFSAYEGYAFNGIRNTDNDYKLKVTFKDGYGQLFNNLSFMFKSAEGGTYIRQSTYFNFVYKAEYEDDSNKHLYLDLSLDYIMFDADCISDLRQNNAVSLIIYATASFAQRKVEVYGVENNVVATHYVDCNGEYPLHQYANEYALYTSQARTVETLLADNMLRNIKVNSSVYLKVKETSYTVTFKNGETTIYQADVTYDISTGNAEKTVVVNNQYMDNVYYMPIENKLPIGWTTDSAGLGEVYDYYNSFISCGRDITVFLKTINPFTIKFVNADLDDIYVGNRENLNRVFNNDPIFEDKKFLYWAIDAGDSEPIEIDSDYKNIYKYIVNNELSLCAVTEDVTLITSTDEIIGNYYCESTENESDMKFVMTISSNGDVLYASRDYNVTGNFYSSVVFKLGKIYKENDGDYLFKVTTNELSTRYQTFDDIYYSEDEEMVSYNGRDLTKCTAEKYVIYVYDINNSSNSQMAIIDKPTQASIDLTQYIDLGTSKKLFTPEGDAIDATLPFEISNLYDTFVCTTDDFYSFNFSLNYGNDVIENITINSMNYYSFESYEPTIGQGEKSFGWFSTDGRIMGDSISSLFYSCKQYGESGDSFTFNAVIREADFDYSELEILTTTTQKFEADTLMYGMAIHVALEFNADGTYVINYADGANIEEGEYYYDETTHKGVVIIGTSNSYLFSYVRNTIFMEYGNLTLTKNVYTGGLTDKTLIVPSLADMNEKLQIQAYKSGLVVIKNYDEQDTVYGEYVLPETTDDWDYKIYIDEQNSLYIYFVEATNTAPAHYRVSATPSIENFTNVLIELDYSTSVNSYDVVSVFGIYMDPSSTEMSAVYGLYPNFVLKATFVAENQPPLTDFVPYFIAEDGTALTYYFDFSTKEFAFQELTFMEVQGYTIMNFDNKALAHVTPLQLGSMGEMMESIAEVLEILNAMCETSPYTTTEGYELSLSSNTTTGEIEVTYDHDNDPLTDNLTGKISYTFNLADGSANWYIAVKNADGSEVITDSLNIVVESSGMGIMFDEHMYEVDLDL